MEIQKKQLTATDSKNQGRDTAPPESRNNLPTHEDKKSIHEGMSEAICDEIFYDASSKYVKYKGSKMTHSAALNQNTKHVKKPNKVIKKTVALEGNKQIKKSNVSKYPRNSGEQTDIFFKGVLYGSFIGATVSTVITNLILERLKK